MAPGRLVGSLGRRAVLGCLGLRTWRPAVRWNLFHVWCEAPRHGLQWQEWALHSFKDGQITPGWLSACNNGDALRQQHRGVCIFAAIPGHPHFALHPVARREGGRSVGHTANAQLSIHRCREQLARNAHSTQRYCAWRSSAETKRRAPWQPGSLGALRHLQGNQTGTSRQPPRVDVRPASARADRGSALRPVLEEIELRLQQVGACSKWVPAASVPAAARSQCRLRLRSPPA
jgi:hypothetical protein